MDQRCALRRHPFHFTLNSVFQLRFGNLQVVVQLQVQPRLCIRTEVARQPQCRTLRHVQGERILCIEEYDRAEQVNLPDLPMFEPCIIWLE